MAPHVPLPPVSSSLRIKLTLGLVALLAVWPLAHFFVVKAMRLSPWNFYGWAMYTKPNDHVRAETFNLQGEPLLGDGITAQQLNELQKAYLDWGLRQVAIGSNQQPIEYARGVLQLKPDWEGIVIKAERVGLDNRSGFYTILETMEFTYRRDELLP